MDQMRLSSVMLCDRPLQVDKKLVLSASGVVWPSLDKVPSCLDGKLLDEWGRNGVIDAYALQFASKEALEICDRSEIYTCFRMVQSDVFDMLGFRGDVTEAHLDVNGLVSTGWDVCSGAEWMPASNHGIYPDALSKEAKNKDIDLLNEYCLFSQFEHCVDCCAENNKHIPEHDPWFPVRVMTSRSSLERLLFLFNSSDGLL